VTDLDYAGTLVADTVAEYGAVHGLTNFAGILRDSMVFNMDEDEFGAVVDVHLKGHLSLVRATSSHWRDRHKAEGFDRERSLTCVSSGVAAGNPGQANYSAAKAGVPGLMRTAARELLETTRLSPGY
jgi:NAD(P)-dependent dehydrogenase (short-subunit alcohol dehydrogenase family)